MARRPEAFSTTRDCAREAFRSGAVPAQRRRRRGLFPCPKAYGAFDLWSGQNTHRGGRPRSENSLCRRVRTPDFFRKLCRMPFGTGKRRFRLGKGLKPFRMGGKAGERSLAAPFGGVQSRVRHVEGFVECAGKRVETDPDACTVGINHIVPDDAPVLGFEEFPG